MGASSEGAIANICNANTTFLHSFDYTQFHKTRFGLRTEENEGSCVVPRELYHIECSFLFSTLYEPCIRPRPIGPCPKPGRRCRPGWQKARRHGRRRSRAPCHPLLIVADWSCRCCRPLPSLGQAVRGRTLESADSKSPLITSSTERANEQEHTFVTYVAQMHNQPVVNPMLITSHYRSQHI